MLRFTFAKDNDYDVYLLGLPSGLSITGFLALTDDQTAAAIHEQLAVTFVHGTHDIPATETTPAMEGVTCYKATFEGDRITDHAGSYVGQPPLVLIVREGRNMRRFAEVEIVESLPLEPA